MDPSGVSEGWKSSNIEEMAAEESTSARARRKMMKPGNYLHFLLSFITIIISTHTDVPAPTAAAAAPGTKLNLSQPHEGSIIPHHCFGGRGSGTS